MAQTVTVGLINQSATQFAPVVIHGRGQSSSAANRSTLRRTKVRASPDTRRGPHRIRGDDGGSTLRFGHRTRGVYQVAKVGQQVLPGLIDQSTVLFGPAFSNIQVKPALLDQSAIVFTPQFNQKVSLGLLDNSSSTFAPLLQGAQSVTLGLLDQSATTFAPGVNAHLINLGLLDNSAVVFSPTQVKQKVSPGLVDQSAVLFAPSSISGAVSLTDILDQSATTFAPAFAQTKTVSPSLLDNSASTFAPTVNLAPPQTVSLDLTDQSAVTVGLIIHVPVKPLITQRGRYRPTLSKKGRYVPTIHKKGTFIA